MSEESNKLISGLGASIENSAKPKKKLGKVNVSSLNVRSKPDKTGSKIGKLKFNEEVEILEKTGKWYKINKDSLDAYVVGKYITDITDGEVVEALIVGYVTVGSLNVRNTIKGDVVGKLKKDETVDIVEDINGWYKIKFEDDFAYVSDKYITTKEPKAPTGYLYQDKNIQTVAMIPAKKLAVTGGRTSKIIAETYNKFGGLLEVLASKTGIEVATSIAVMSVESGGKGFEDGKAIIRFENHLFFRLWGKKNPDTFKKYFKYGSPKQWLGHKFRNNVKSEWADFHGKQTKEWEVLEFARKLSNDDALKSISIGLPQILGSNYKMIGYANVKEMFDNFAGDIRYQIMGLFDFFTPRMKKALKNHDFVNFAKYYNGPGQASRYGKFIQDFYEAFPKK